MEGIRFKLHEDNLASHLSTLAISSLDANLGKILKCLQILESLMMDGKKVFQKVGLWMKSVKLNCPKIGQ